ITLCAVAAVALAGCSDAPDPVTGGDPLTGDPCKPGGANSGSHWQDLYTCYFGPSSPASCGSQGASCHGSATALGGKFFVCGQSQYSCWQGLLKMGVPDGGAADPTMTLLYSVLRKTTGNTV